MIRSAIRRGRWAIVTALLLGLATVLLLFALDIKRWQRTVTRDDLRFRALPGHVGLWKSPSVLPGDPAERLLGMGDAIEYRHALQLFWYSRVGGDPTTHVDVNATRVDTQDTLSSLMVSGKTARERSNAANLLGVMTMTNLSPEDESALQTLHRAQGYFRKAIAADGTNETPKQNLELSLLLVSNQKKRYGKDSKGGFGFGRGHGAHVSGTGF